MRANGTIEATTSNEIPEKWNSLICEHRGGELANVSIKANQEQPSVIPQVGSVIGTGETNHDKAMYISLTETIDIQNSPTKFTRGRRSTFEVHLNDSGEKDE